MKAFVVLAVILAVASARVLRAPGVATLLDLQKQGKIPDGKIIGGNPASLGQFPWQSSLHMDQSYICGGSILTANYLLTAAHCVDGFSSYQMAIGQLVWNSFTHSGTWSMAHPNYNPSIISNDVGLVRFSSPVSFNDNARPTTLPWGSSDQYVGTPVTVSGWGRTQEGGSVSSTLNWVQLTTISNDQCSQAYPGIINSGTLCTGVQSGQSTCNGDSGGPLVVTASNVQIGVVSFVSSGGCTASHHGFARVTTFLDWIQANSDVSP